MEVCPGLSRSCNDNREGVTPPTKSNEENGKQSKSTNGKQIKMNCPIHFVLNFEGQTNTSFVSQLKTKNSALI